MSENIHDHGEGCTCGCHAHAHEHEHEHGAHIHSTDADGIYIEHHMLDSACVVSGRTTFAAEYDALRPRIAAALERIAAEITAHGGIVGHIKAAAEVTQTEVFSVTDVKAMTKSESVQDITLKMASIVFAIDAETVEGLLERELRALRAN